MPLTARLRTEVPGVAITTSSPRRAPTVPLRTNENFLVVVTVKRCCQSPRGKRMMNDCEPPIRLMPVNLPTDPEPPKSNLSPASARIDNGPGDDVRHRVLQRHRVTLHSHRQWQTLCVSCQRLQRTAWTRSRQVERRSRMTVSVVGREAGVQWDKAIVRPPPFKIAASGKKCGREAIERPRNSRRGHGGAAVVRSDRAPTSAPGSSRRRHSTRR